MNFLNGLQNFLQLINDNWTTIIVIIGLALAIFKKAKSYFSKSDDEKIAIAKKQITETMLKMITDAEVDYEDWNKAGSIKRSQVIKEIFKDGQPYLFGKLICRAAFVLLTPLTSLHREKL